MAGRRMFAKSVVGSDDFLDLPLSARGLYLHLVVEADDDGFLGSVRSLLRMSGARSDDLNALVDGGYLLSMGDGVYVIRHWLSQNAIRKDRYTPTVYSAKVKCLGIDTDKNYFIKNTSIGCENDNGFKTVAERLPIGCQAVAAGQSSLGQSSLGQSSLGQSSLGQSSLSPSREDDGLDRQDERKRNLDRITERFAACYGRHPDKEFIEEVLRALDDGKPVDGLLDVVCKTAERRPRYPDRYTQKAIADYQPPAEEARKPWQPSPAPTGELTDWERDWLADIERRRKARETEGGKTDETM